jgi:hypothetical protein
MRELFLLVVRRAAFRRGRDGHEADLDQPAHEIDVRPVVVHALHERAHAGGQLIQADGGGVGGGGEGRHARESRV